MEDKNTRTALLGPLDSIPLPGGNTLGGLASQLPGGHQMENDGNSLKIENRPNAPIEMGMDQNMAIAALESYGFSRERALLECKRIEAGGFGEPRFIYDYLNQAATLGATVGVVVSSKEYFDFVMYMLAKAAGNPQVALTYLKTITDFAKQSPGANLMQVAIDIANGRTSDATAAIYMTSLGDKKMNPILVTKFMEFIGNPNGPLLAEMQNYIRTRHKRRVDQQLFELKFDLALSKMMEGVERDVTNRFSGWIKGFEDNRLIQNTLKAASLVYKGALIWNTMSQSTGMYGKGFLEDGSGLAKKSDAIGKIRLAAAPVAPVAPTAADSVAPQGGIPTGATVYTNNYTDLLNGIANTNSVPPAQQKQLLTSLSQIAQKTVMAEQSLATCENIYKNIIEQLNAQEDSGDNYSVSVRNLGVPLLDTPELSQRASVMNQQANAAAQTVYELFNLVRATIDTLNAIPTTYLDSQTKANAIINANNRLSELQSQEQRALNYEAFGIFWLAYLPIQREITKVQVDLKYIIKQRETWSADNSALGGLMKASLYPLVSQEIALYREIIRLNTIGINAIQQKGLVNQRNANIAAMLINKMKDIRNINMSLDLKIQQLMTQLSSQDMKATTAPGLQVQSPFASNSSDRMIRTSKFKKVNKLVMYAEDKEPDEEDKMFRDSDEVSEKYWNDLYDDDPPYGTELEHPEKHRKDKEHKRRKKSDVFSTKFVKLKNKTEK